MRQICVTLLLITTFSASGQDVERIVTTYPKSIDVKEVYFVLKSDKKIKQGDYFLFFKGELTTKDLKTKNIYEIVPGVKESGQFANNLKDGQWTYFKEPTSNRRLEEGKYSKGKKTGVWETFIEDGKVIKSFDSDNNKELPIIVKTIWKYPSTARKNQIEGLVRIKITYDSCVATGYQVLADIGYGCSNAVIESLKEKQILEKKYGVKSLKCDMKEEIVEVEFKLDK
jgi:hypothetical protein